MIPGSVMPSVLPDAVAAQLEPAEFRALVERYLLEKQGYAARGIAYSPLTSQHRLPTIAPTRVHFRDVLTGQWLTGQSEPKIDCNAFRMSLRVEAYEPCATKAHWHRPGGCACPKRLTSVSEGPANLLTNVWAKLSIVGIFGQTTSVTDTTANSRSVTAAVLGGGITTKAIWAGTGATAAAVEDQSLQTPTESVAATVNAVSGTGATGTFTVTGTVTATADRDYKEAGILCTTTTNSWIFCVAHDSFATKSVSNSGTLAVTYSISNS